MTKWNTVADTSVKVCTGYWWVDMRRYPLPWCFAAFPEDNFIGYSKALLACKRREMKNYSLPWNTRPLQNSFCLFLDYPWKGLLLLLLIIFEIMKALSRIIWCGILRWAIQLYKLEVLEILRLHRKIIEHSLPLQNWEALRSSNIFKEISSDEAPNFTFSAGSPIYANS